MDFKVIMILGLIGCGGWLCRTKAQTFELAPNSKDTINYVDATGKKQKHWILFGKHKPGTCYTSAQKVEEGDYKENRKMGVWMEFYCNGQIKNKISFLNGRADGYAVIYYLNGNVQEEGQWKNNRWVGDLKQYYENGQLQHEFKYNESGKREGLQVYKYENGQVAIKGSFADGKEVGVIKEFTENGQLKAEKTYNNGNLEVATINTFLVKSETAKEMLPVPSDAPILVVKAGEKHNDDTKIPSILNGKHTLYDNNKNVTKDGIFNNNIFIDGKAYIYNENGILQRILIYKNGKYIGDGIMER